VLVEGILRVRNIELYMCLYCVSCNSSIYSLYNEGHSPLRGCGVFFNSLHGAKMHHNSLRKENEDSGKTKWILTR